MPRPDQLPVPERPNRMIMWVIVGLVVVGLLAGAFSVWVIFDVPGSEAIVKAASGSNQAAQAQMEATLSNVAGAVDDTPASHHAERAVSLLLAQLPHTTNVDQAEKILKEATALVIKNKLDPSTLAKQWANLGDKFVIARNRTKAQVAYDQWAKLVDPLRRARVAETMDKSADVYRQTDLTNAEICALRQLALIANLPSDAQNSASAGAANALATLGWVYREQQRYSDASHVYQQASNVTPGDKLMDQAMLQLDMAWLDTAQARYPDADKEYNKAAEIFDKMGNHFWEGLTYAKMSSSKFDQHAWDSAEEAANKGLSLMMSNQSQGDYGWRTAYYFPEAIFSCGQIYYHDDHKDKLLNAFAQGLQYMDSHGLANSHFAATYLSRYIVALQNCGRPQEAQALQKRLEAMRLNPAGRRTN